MAINDGKRFPIDVPAASAVGPAQLFFGHNEPIYVTIVLRNGTGETVIDSVTPKLTEFSYTCRFDA